MKCKVIILSVVVLLLAFSLISCDKDPEVMNTPKPTPTATKVPTATPVPTPTPEPTPIPDYTDVYLGADFAKKAAITVEGHETGNVTRPKEMMVDGDPLTRWAYKKFPTEVVFDFGAPFVLSKGIFTWIEIGRTYYYELYTSNDGVNYNMIADHSSDSEPYETIDDFGGVFARYVIIVMTDNESHNGWAAINEVDIEGFTFANTPYSVDHKNKKIEIPEAVTKEVFIENCKLGGLFEASVQSSGSKVAAGDYLVVKCGDAEFKYQIVIK